jgi:two-component system chemotaxis response regulator CheY
MVSVTDVQVIKRLVILIADSRSYSRALLRSMLLQLEVKKIHEAGDGAAAIESILTVNPDVMLLDWDISVVGAPEVLSMAQNPSVVPNPDLPIIVISSSGKSSFVHKAIELGARQFMIRPISPKMLQQRLIKIVREARKVARIQKSGVRTPRAKRQTPESQEELRTG